MIGTPEYKLAKFLDTIMKPYIPNTYLINSTNDFLYHMKDFLFYLNQFLVNFDTKSLFINMCRKFAGIIAEYIFSPECKDQPPYNNKLYKQIGVVAMGSPLGCAVVHWQIFVLAI